MYSIIQIDTGYRMQEEKDVNARTQGCKGYRIQDQEYPSQPGGPSKEGPADIYDAYILINVYIY